MKACPAWGGGAGKTLALVVMAVSALLAGCGGGRAARVALTVTPSPSLSDEPIALRVTGLRGGQAATLRASWTAFDGMTWKSARRIRADAKGVVSLRGMEAARVLWSMRPTGPHARAALGFLPPARGLTRVDVTVVADGKPVAHAHLVRRVTEASVRVRPLMTTRDGLFGFFFSPTGGQRRPTVLALGGSEGVTG